MLIPVTMNSEVPHRDNPIVWYAFSNISLRFSNWVYKFMKLPAMTSGCTIRPTHRSVDARPQSNRMDGERRDGVFHTPYNTNAFPVIARKARAKFTTQLAVMMKCWATVSFIFAPGNSNHQLRLWCAHIKLFPLCDEHLFFPVPGGRGR